MILYVYTVYKKGFYLSDTRSLLTLKVVNIADKKSTKTQAPITSPTKNLAITVTLRSIPANNEVTKLELMAFNNPDKTITKTSDL